MLYEMKYCVPGSRYTIGVPSTGFRGQNLEVSPLYRGKPLTLLPADYRRGASYLFAFRVIKPVCWTEHQRPSNRTPSLDFRKLRFFLCHCFGGDITAPRLAQLLQILNIDRGIDHSMPSLP